MRNVVKVTALIAALVVVAAGIGTAAAVLTTPAPSSASTGVVRPGLDDSPEAGDVKGPCDEAEHAGEPECAGVQVPEDEAADEPGEIEDEPGEIEEDNSGPGNAHDDEGVEDSSGPSENAGPGNVHDRDEGEDHSGPDHGGDDEGGDDSRSR